MTRTVKYIGGIIFLLLIVSIAIGFYMFNKPRDSAASQNTTSSISANSLYNEYQKNEAAANLKYLGKIIEVQGKLAVAANDSLQTNLSLYTGHSEGLINCQMFNGLVKANLKQGDLINVKGKCTGFLMDVNLVDCIIQ